MSRLPTTDAIDVSALSSELADYSIGNKHEIFMNMFYSDMWQDRFRVIDGIKDKEPLFNFDIDLDLRPQADYKAFAEQNDVFKIGNRYLQTEEVKLDLLIVPMELQRSYFAYAFDKGSNQFDMGIVEYFFIYLNKKIQEKMHLKAFYQGVRNDAGTTTVDTMDGMLEVVANEITATTLTPVATGIVTSANAVDSVEAMADAAESVPAWSTTRKELVVNNEIFNWYWQGRRDTYKNLIQSYEGNIKHIDRLPVEGYNVDIVREHGLGTSQRMICTPRDNKVLGFDSEADLNRLLFQPFNRTIKVMMDFKVGFNFATLYDGAVTVNDQA